MSGIRIANLFDLYRFQEQQEFHKVLLYFPFGFLLLLFRLTLSMLIWPVLALLPRSSNVRRFVLKCVSLCYGIWIKHNDKCFDNKIKLLVCNHTNVLDHMVVESVKPCKLVNVHVQPSKWNAPTFFWMPDERDYRNVTNFEISIAQKYIADIDAAVLIFPEGTMTNGKVGLLKFSVWPFALNLPVQPIVLQISDVSFINVSRSVIGTNTWYDFLWALFVPYTVFTMRTLPPMMKMENESAEEFSQRVQHIMASSLNLISTVYTAKDKEEYRKRLQSSSNNHTQSTHTRERRSNSPNLEINQMAKQIKEILPEVPFNVLLQDLAKTRCVDETISRILEGSLQYIPEGNPFSHSASTSSVSDNTVPSSSSTFSSSASPFSILKTKPKEFPSSSKPVVSFGKSPRERMQSYQERKAALIESARFRYMQKHGML